MPVAKVQLPDGRIASFDVPDGTSPQQVLTYAENYFGKGLTQTPNYGPPSMKESMAQASAEMGTGKSAVAGIGTWLSDVDARIRQLLGQTLTPQETQAVQAGRVAPGAVQAGRMVGDLGLALATAPTGIVSNMAAGGAQRFLTEPVLEGESGLANAGKGAVGAGLGYTLAKGLQHIVRPITPSRDVQALVNEGVIPTPGAAAAQTNTLAGRTLGKAEEAATSIFGVGAQITAAKERAFRELNRAGLARATPRGMTVTENVGREGLDDTYNAISSRYREALDAIGVVRPDALFPQQLNQRVNQAVIGMERDQIPKIRQIIQDIIGNRNSPVGGAYTADIAKQVDTDLGARLRDFQIKGDRLEADAVRAAQTAWRDLIRRNAPDQPTRDMLDDAQRAFANYVRMERATGKPAAAKNAGVPNATQFNQAVRETAPEGVRHAGYARGQSLMEDLSDPAVRVLSDRLGDSGTASRGLLAAISLGLGAGAYGSNEANLNPAITGMLAAAALGPLAYSRTGSRYAVGDLFPGVQNPLATFLEQSAPYAGALGRTLYERKP